MDEVFSDKGQLAEDVFPDFGNLGEEEEREDAGRHAEAGGDRAVAVGFYWGEAHQVGDVFCSMSGRKVLDFVLSPYSIYPLFVMTMVVTSKTLKLFGGAVDSNTDGTYLGP